MDTDLMRMKAKLSSLLRDRPRGTTADIADHTVVYWDGQRPVGAHLCADHPGFDGQFDLDDHFHGDAYEHLANWFVEPHYSLRPDLAAWLDAAPREPRKDR